MNIYLFLINLGCVIYLCSFTEAFPIDHEDNNLELKDEVRFPNGTVTGKYVYTDSEGNPIHVKYFADNTSYGVELQTSGGSFFQNNWGSSVPQPYDVLKPQENKEARPQNAVKPNDNKREDKNRAKHAKKVRRPNEGYDVFYKNEIQVPLGQGHCAEDKVKVYLQKDKREINDEIDDFEVPKYCDQF